MIGCFNEEMNNNLDVYECDNSSSFKLTPVYQRRFFLTSDLATVSDTDSFESSRKSPCHTNHVKKKCYENSVEKKTNKLRVNVDPFYDIYIPVAESLALIFRHLHGISPSATVSKTLSEVYDTRILLQPLGKPKLQERQLAMHQYLNICIGMRQWLEYKNVSSGVLYYPPFATSYALFDLYYFLWYSNAEDCQKKKTITEMYQEKECLSFQNDKEEIKFTFFSVPIFLLAWYKRHVVQLSSQHLAKEVLRAMILFEYDLSNAPILIQNEISEHIARLLLLCHFNEFFQCLIVFCHHKEPLAHLLHATLVDKVLEKSSTIWTENLENKVLHEPFLERLRSIVRNLPTHWNENNVENFESMKKKSIFACSFDILYGNGERIDSVIQKVFPKCWLSSFILGWFWKRLENVESIMSTLLQNTTLQWNTTGTIVEYFFKSWLKEYELFQTIDHSKTKDMGLISLLSRDMVQFVEFLRKHSNYSCSPVLVDLISYDHPFKQCISMCKEIFLNQKVKHFVSDSIAMPYFFRLLLDTRFEILHCPFKNNFSWRQSLSLGHVQRKSRYTLQGINDTVATTSIQAKMPNLLLCENSCQTLEETLLVFLYKNELSCEEICSFLLEKKRNISWGILGCLLWDVRHSNTYSKMAYHCHLLDAFLTGQPCIFLLSIYSSLLNILKAIASQWFGKDTESWEGFMLILFCITMEFDMDYLKTHSTSNKVSYEENITGHLNLTSSVSPILNENKAFFCSNDSEFTWREKIHYNIQHTSFQRMDFQTNDFLTNNIEKWMNNCIEKKQTKNSNLFFICLPSWCQVPQEYTKQAVSFLFLTHIYCPVLVFYLILNHYLEDYKFIQALKKDNYLNNLTRDNETRSQQCLYWLLKCLLEKFVPVHEFQSVMTLLHYALTLEMKGKGKICFFTLKQLQEIQNFMTFYTTGMLQDLYNLKEKSLEKSLCELVMKAQEYKTGCEVICTQLELEEWKPWIFQHFF